MLYCLFIVNRFVEGDLYNQVYGLAPHIFKNHSWFESIYNHIACLGIQGSSQVT